MSKYRLSALAERDLADIADYTVDRWGAKQAELYFEQFIECFVRIVRLPDLGRLCESVYPGLRRIEQGSHVVFYLIDDGGIFITRIFHRSMLPARQELMAGGKLKPSD